MPSGLPTLSNKMKVIPRDIDPSFYGIRAAKADDGTFDIMEFKDGLVLHRLDKGRIGLFLSGDAADSHILKSTHDFDCVEDIFVRSLLIQVAC